MLGHQFAYSAAPVRKVRELQFGILCPEEINAHSIAKIEHPEVMDETTHKPEMSGLMDPRMGAIDRNFKCQTCGEGMSECPGHLGHIELARPVFHPGFVIKVKKILECVCVCVNCGKLESDIRSRRTKEENEGNDDDAKKGHGGCGSHKFEKGLKLFVQYKKSKDEDEEMKSLQPDKRLCPPSEVYAVLRKI